MEHEGMKGEMVDDDTPVWAPLEEAVGDDLVGWFMWMYWCWLEDGTAVHAYKHRSTRNYLLLDPTGGVYWWGDGRYHRMPLSRAIDRVFSRWSLLGATRRELDLVDAAWDRARLRETGQGGRTAA
jgi:hypothetical protein